MGSFLYYVDHPTSPPLLPIPAPHSFLRLGQSHFFNKNPSPFHQNKVHSLIIPTDSPKLALAPHSSLYASPNSWPGVGKRHQLWAGTISSCLKCQGWARGVFTSPLALTGPLFLFSQGPQLCLWNKPYLLRWHSQCKLI